MLKDIANKYNTALKKMGDTNPDFIEAVRDLTAESCRELNQNINVNTDIYCQSVGSRLNKSTNGKFSLNWTYKLVKYFDGSNDGLVGENSFKWGEKYTFLTTKSSEGISHGDMIDLTRKNLDGFDVREFYVQLVNDLKLKGY